MNLDSSNSHLNTPQAQVLAELGCSLRHFARQTEMSRGTAWRLLSQGQWPVRGTAALVERIELFLRNRGATSAQQAAFLHGIERASARTGASAFGRLVDELAASRSKKTPARSQHAGAPEASSQLATPEDDNYPREDLMLLEYTPLTDQAREAFGLHRNPFADDIQSREDVFQSADIRRVRASLFDAAMHHGFVAVIGESGSGKTTLREDLEQRILDEGHHVIVIKPYVLGMEPSETLGKPMRTGQIAEAVARALAPSVQLKSSPEARFAQVHNMLRDSCRAGNRHLVLIEEAHRMPMATIKHLKGWLELKDGLRRLLGVCLIGQTELGDRLGENMREIREIVQRVEKIHVPPLAEDLERYLAHKLDRAGVPVDAVLAADAYDAIRARLIYRPRNSQPKDWVSVCYPQAVNNLVARAMNAAARNGWPKVDRQVVAGC